MKENKYESIKQIFAERLQKIRKRNGFSQFETAKALGISQPTVSIYRSITNGTSELLLAGGNMTNYPIRKTC